MDHYSIANAGHASPFQCSCGGSYATYGELESHLSNLGAGDKRTMNPIFNQPMGIPAEVFLNAKFPSRPLFSEFRHSWKNYTSITTENPSYICTCGEEFDEHQHLMNHTADLNPPMNPVDFGSAGAAIERTAHEKTFEQLNKAVNLIEAVYHEELVVNNAKLIDFDWYDEAKKFLKGIGREIDE